MSLPYIRDAYRVPARRGARIRYTGEPKPREGVIVGAQDAHLRVRFDDSQHLNQIDSLHPTWEVQYLPTNPTTKEN
jgi:hypothetical protein